MSLPMRYRLMLEPPEQLGGPERIFSITEEWHGNSLVTDRNTFPPFYGSMHRRLRRFTGVVLAQVIGSGWL